MEEILRRLLGTEKPTKAALRGPTPITTKASGLSRLVHAL